jgi:hypothetical protein
LQRLMEKFIVIRSETEGLIEAEGLREAETEEK